MFRIGRVSAALLAIPLMMAAGACGSDDSDPAPTGTAAQGSCAEDTRADTFAQGLERAGDDGMFTLRLEQGQPAPPELGDNEWVVELLDSSGAPLDGAVMQVKAWMPDHGHGTVPLFHDLEPMGEPGMYRVGPLDLFMAGFWQFTFTIESDGVTDEAVLGFCLEG